MLKLEVEVDIRDVVKRSVVKVEPHQLVGVGVFVADCASVESGGNLNSQRNGHKKEKIIFHVMENKRKD